MARITVSRHLSARHDRVWQAVSNLEAHPDWMKDAKSLAFLTEQRRGAGTRMRVETAVGPFHTIDLMEVVGWEEGHSIEVVHQGLVEGVGTLSVEPEGEHTAVTWMEELKFPWWLGGQLTAWVARPALVSMWRGNLARLEETVIQRGDDPPQTPRRPTAG